MKQKLPILISLFLTLNIFAQDLIAGFSTENGTHSLTTDKMFTHYFTTPSTDYDLRELGINLHNSTTTTDAVIRFGIYDLESTNLLWESGDVSITGGIEEYVYVSIPANTLTLIMNKSYRVAVLGDPKVGGSIIINAFPSPTNEGVATVIESANFAYYNGKTNYPNFPSQIEPYNSPDTISWYRAISVVVKGDAQILSIGNNILMENIDVYPNPASNEVNIKLNNNISLKSVTLYNILGEKVKVSQNNQINVEDLNNGIYIINISTSKGKIVKKLIVK